MTIGFTCTCSLSFREIPKYYNRNNSIKGIYKSYSVWYSVFYLLVFSFLSIHDVTNQTQVFLLCVFYYTFPTFLFIDTEPLDHLLIHCHCPTQSLNERHTKSAAFYEWIYNIDVLECIAYLYSAGKNIYLYSNSLKNSSKLLNTEGRVM